MIVRAVSLNYSPFTCVYYVFISIGSLYYLLFFFIEKFDLLSKEFYWKILC